MLDWLRRRKQPPARGQRTARSAVALPMFSRQEDITRFGRALDTFIPLPNATPFEMLQVYRVLRDVLPDVSDGIWTWKRLCQTGFDIEMTDAGSELAARRATELLDALNRRVNSGDRGMDGLLDIFYTSLFTYGAAALEIVPTRSRESIHDVVPIDVWTLRFRREDDGRLQVYQLHEGEEIALPMERLIYVGLDRDGTNPYGRSMLRSLPFVLKIQQRLIEDMAKAVHNAGWSKLHIRYHPEERQRGESIAAYRERVEGAMDALASNVTGLQPDQNLITYDNVEIAVVRGDQHATVFYENHKVIEEQVITGLHLMPILLGRNYGTTETYGTAQFEIINRQVESVNRSVKRILEQLYNFELALMWGQARARVHLRNNRTTDVLKEAQTRKHEIENALKLRDRGWINDEQAKALLNL